MDDLYIVSIDSEEEGTRTFIFNAEDQRDAENFAKQFANDFDAELVACELARPNIGCVMELCTF